MVARVNSAPKPEIYPSCDMLHTAAAIGDVEKARIGVVSCTQHYKILWECSALEALQPVPMLLIVWELPITVPAGTGARIINWRQLQVKSLLSHGVDVNAASRFGMTALHIAAMMDQAAVVTELMESAAHVDKTATDGSTPLHIACQENSTDAVAALLRHVASCIVLVVSEAM